jgi:hypothetical protein
MKCLRLLPVLFLLASSAPVLAGNWQAVKSPNLGSDANSLSSVAAVTDNDIWAAGWGWDQTLNAYRTVIEHWNGQRWSLVSSPNATNGYNLLNGVGVVASNDVWAVGQAANGSTYRTLIEHWNGNAWSIFPSPNVPGLSNILEAITVISANDIWAVGYSSDSNFNNFTLTLHWDGNSWSIVPSPTLDHDILFGVDAVASNDVWAVGRSRPGGYGDDRTLTMHWDGQSWRIVPSPSGIGDNDLFGVAAIAPNDVWAVGNEGSLSTLAEHWDGTSWTIVGTPNFNANATNQVLVGIVALSSNNIWTAGQYIVPLQGSAQFTLTENWDGTNWNFVPSPNRRNSNNRLHGITVTPSGTLWAVGTTGVFAQPERTLIMRRTP